MYRNWQYGYALHTASLTFLPVRLLHMGWREGISRFDFLSFSFVECPQDFRQITEVVEFSASSLAASCDSAPSGPSTIFKFCRQSRGFSIRL